MIHNQSNCQGHLNNRDGIDTLSRWLSGQRQVASVHDTDFCDIVFGQRSSSIRFTLSFRDVDDLLAERGIDVSNETVRRWFLKFGLLDLRQSSRSARQCSLALDEMVIKVRGRRYWLWRAVDDEGEALDFLGPATTMR